MSTDDDDWGSGAWGDEPLGASLPVSSGVTLPAPTDRAHPFATPDADRYAPGPLLGRGGMGKVVATEDRRLRRTVARKEVVADGTGSTAETTRRLAQEAWITAQLEHPGIVPVYDAGTTADGQLFYTMRLIRGRSLAARLRAIGELPAAQQAAARLALVRPLRDACEAMGYAHSLGIVHRDLKPANILVGEFGETQVADWGLARPIDGEDTGWAETVVPEQHGARTVFGGIVGTPGFMAPEQARGLPPCPGSDVFSLGATLYTILAGRRLHEGDDAMKRAQAGALPSLDDLDVAPELVAILRRALAPAPAERYPDAKSLADELTRWLEGHRVSAYSYSQLELARRFAREHRGALIAATLGLVLALAALVAGVVRTEAQRQRARLAEDDALQREADAVRSQAAADEALAEAMVLRARSLARLGARPEAETLAAEALALAPSHPGARGVLSAEASPSRPRLLSRTPFPRCNGARFAGPDLIVCKNPDAITARELPSSTVRWETPRESWDWAEVSGDRVLLLDEEGQRLQVCDPSDGTALSEATYPGEVGGRIWVHPRGLLGDNRTRLFLMGVDGTYDLRQVCPDPAGATGTGRTGTIVTLCGEEWWVREGWDSAPRPLSPLPRASLDAWRAEPSVLQRDGTPHPLVIHVTDDGERALVGTLAGGLLQLDLEGGQVEAQAQAAFGAVERIALTPDGTRAIVTGSQGGPLIWNLEHTAWEARLPERSTGAVHWIGPDRVRVVTADAVEDWQVPEGGGRWIRNDSGMSAVAWAGRDTLVVGDGNGAVSAWTTEGTRRWYTTLGDGPVLDLGVSSGGLYASHRHGTAWRIDHASGAPTAIRPHPLSVSRRVLPLGASLVIASYRSGGYVDPVTGEWASVFAAVDPGTTEPAGTSLSPLTGATSASPTGDVGYMSFGNGRILRMRGTPGDQETVAWDDDHRRIAWAPGDVLWVGGGDEVRELPLAVGAEGPRTEALRRIALPGGKLQDLVVSPDGRWLAVTTLVGEVQVFSLETEDLVVWDVGHDQRAFEAAFSPDGATLATIGWDGRVRLYDVATWTASPDELRERAANWGLGREDALGALLR